jgi:signal transduction histidine kinase/ABC-type amino acid transport substrate-binding protein/DNA-binding NarL/FixJ family response regulator
LATVCKKSSTPSSPPFFPAASFLPAILFLLAIVQLSFVSFEDRVVFAESSSPDTSSLVNENHDSRSSSKQEPVVAVLRDFPPLYQFDEGGNPSGFAIELFQEVAEESDWNIQPRYLIVDNWAEALQAVREGEADLIPGIGISPERKEEFAFTRPMETLPVVCFVRAEENRISRIEELRGHFHTAVINKSAAMTRLQELGSYHLDPMNNIDSALNALLAGRVDAFIFPEPVLRRKLRQMNLSNKVKVVGQPLLLLKRGYLLRRGDEELLSELNKSLDQVVTSNEYARIYARWYGEEEPFWSSERWMRLFLFFALLTFAALVALIIRRRIHQKWSRKLKRQNQRMTLALQTAHLAMWEWHIGTDDLYMYPGHHQDGEEPFTQGFLYSFESLLQRVHADHRDRVRRALLDYAEGRADFFEEEYRYWSPRKKWQWAYSRGKITQRDAMGHPTLIVGFNQNITNLKKAEESLNARNRELAEFKELLEVINEHIADGVLYFHDTSLRIGWANPAAAKIAQKHPRELVGYKCHQVLHCQETPCENCPVVEAIEKKQPVQTTHQTADGRTFSMNAVPILKNGHVSGIVQTFKDISNRVRLERKLRRAKENAEEAARAKAMFLACMSHEIRTPMNGIISMAEMLCQLPLEPKARKYAGIVRDASRDLLYLLNDILDYSKIEAGKELIDRSPFSVRQMIDHVQSLHRQNAENKGLTLEIDYPEVVPDMVWGDRFRIRQILNNLLSNAIKFTDPPGEIRLRIEESRKDRGLAFLVEDTGIGLSPGEIEKLFQAFEQSPRTGRRQYQGTGLGLAISKELAELMGGTITVESRKGVGSTFRCSLPLPPAEEEQVHESLTASHDGGTTPIGARVLLADDNEVNAKVFRLFFEEKLACRVDRAVNGRQAVQKAVAGRYDMIFLDCHMPEMDGIEAASKIKLMLHEMGRACPPLIALTADVFPKMRRQCEEAGMIAFATKPFDFEQLRRLADRFASDQFGAAFRGERPSETPSEPSTPPNAPESQTPTDSPRSPTFDWEQLMKLALGKSEFALELACDMIETGRGVFAELNEALHRGQKSKADQIAHNLKGMAFSCGSPRLGEIAQHLRKAIAQEQLPEIEELRQEALRAFQEYIDAFDHKRAETVPPSRDGAQ